jgi:uncharacterized membrane-anchored protein YitT (DUF2179 family)
MLLPQRILQRLQRRRKPAVPASDFSTLKVRVPFGEHTFFSDWDLRRKLIQIGLLTAAVFSAALGLKGFLLPNEFIDGGVTGMSLLTSQLTGLPLSFLIVIINIPFVIMGYFQLGRGFALRTLVTILALALVLLVISFPTLTQDKLLIAVFGGFFLGAGVGLAMRGGAVLDGTEVLAVYISKRTPLSVGDIILVINIVIFGVAAWLLSVETALYSILAYLSAAKTVDFLIEGIEEYTGVTIISGRSEEIRLMVTEKLGRGVTVYAGKRGYGSRGHMRDDVDIIFTVVTRLEVTHLTAEINKIDEHAFVVMHSVRETRGGLVKKRPLH